LRNIWAFQANTAIDNKALAADRCGGFMFANTSLESPLYKIEGRDYNLILKIAINQFSF
jgi:hypothetical protein